MLGLRGEAGLRRQVVRATALCAFVGYVVWNAVWLSRGRIPPSILLGLTGLPCPTTGGVRSLQALSRGEVLLALHFNPLTPVYLLLLGGTAWMLAGRMLRRRPLLLPSYMGWAWGISLGLGWIAKFVLGRRYW
jgi:hypothetical protein